MQKHILLLALFGTLVLTSCNSVYKSSQTPDDVYYSPAKEETIEEYVKTDERNKYQSNTNDDYNSNNQTGRKTANNRNGNYNNQYYGDVYNEYNFYSDRYTRMRIRNRRLWQDLDYFYYGGNDFRYYGNFNGWHTFNTNVYIWNGYYNPYLNNNFCGNYYGYNGAGYNPINISRPVYRTPPSRPVAFNPASYGVQNRSAGNSTPNNPSYRTPTNSGVRYNNQNTSNSNNNNNRGSRPVSNNNSKPQPSSNRSNDTETPSRSYNSNNNQPSESRPAESRPSSNTPSSSSGSTPSSSGGKSREPK